MTNTDF